MTSDRQHSRIERLKRMVEAMHGHRIALTQQHIAQGQTEKAAKARHQATAFQKVVLLLERELESTNPDSVDESGYVQLSKAWFDVERSASESNEQPPDLRGMQ